MSFLQFLLIIVVITASYMVSYYSITVKKCDAQIPTYLSQTWNRSTSSMTSMTDAVTGNIFEMNRKRFYNGPHLALTDLKITHEIPEGRMCQKWVVITSVNPPTVVVNQLADSDDNLCVVVVADKKSPVEYPINKSHIMYLSVEAQEKLSYRIMNLVPWNHFARKNIGFLYAIHHGAQQIFDLDDDNEFISANDILHQVYSMDKKEFKYIETNQYVTNPYGIYRNGIYQTKQDSYIWPRGYPLEAIKREPDYSFIDQNRTDSSSHIHQIGIIQYLQNVNPDLDAIYRITSSIPSSFDEHLNYCMILKKHSYSPWNAQSTLFNYDTFWGLLLPMTVHGRVSDIWRSFFTQRIMWEKEECVSFCPAIVNHIRNQHQLIKDFDAEMPLYTQSEALLQYLNEWKPVSGDIPQMIEELYIAMYERGILEKKDIRLVQAWIKDLYEIGYQFNLVG